MSVGNDLPDWTPRTCTLPTAQQPFRVAEFDDLFRECVIAVDRADATSVRLTLDGGDEVAARVLDLTARETECCSFFTFTITPNEASTVEASTVEASSGEGLTLDIAVPAEHVGVLDALTERATIAITQRAA